MTKHAIGIINGNSNHQRSRREQEQYELVPEATTEQKIEILREIIERETAKLATYEEGNRYIEVWTRALNRWRRKLAELEAQAEREQEELARQIADDLKPQMNDFLFAVALSCDGSGELEVS